MKKSAELDINYFVELAREKVGYVGKLEFQSINAGGEVAGTFEILKFDKYEKPEFTYSHWTYKEDDTPNGANLGTYIIKLTNTKFYNNKTFKFEVSAFVQKDGKVIDMLFISNINADTHKQLKAYKFPLLNSIFINTREFK